MKAIRTFLIGIMMLIGTSAFAQPMNYNAIRNNARFLTDRMAYTLGIASMDIIDDIYRINYDYIYGINNYLDDIALGYRYDDYLLMCQERDYALRMLLGDILWGRLITFDYFYRPIIFENRRWRFGIYAHDYNRGYYHYSVPRYYDGYRGGHFFGAMHHSHGIGTRGPGMVHVERRGNMNGGHPDMHRGTNNDRQGMNQGRPGVNNDRQGMNQGRPEMNRGNNPTRGENYRPETNRGTTNRSESNMRSSSRSGSYEGNAPTRSGNVSGPSRGGSYNGGSASSPSRGGNPGGGSASAPSRGGNSGGASRGGGMSHGRR